MKATRGIPVFCALALLGVAGAARGGPPFVTDDPEPVDYQHWEFYTSKLNKQ